MMIRTMPSLMNIYGLGKGYGTNPPAFGGGDVAPGGGFTNPMITQPVKGYGLSGGFSGGDVAPGGGFTTPMLPPDTIGKSYGTNPPAFGGGDVAPGGGFAYPRLPYSMLGLMNQYKTRSLV